MGNVAFDSVKEVSMDDQTDSDFNNARLEVEHARPDTITGSRK